MCQVFGLRVRVAPTSHTLGWLAFNTALFMALTLYCDCTLTTGYTGGRPWLWPLRSFGRACRCCRRRGVAAAAVTGAAEADPDLLSVRGLHVSYNVRACGCRGSAVRAVRGVDVSLPRDALLAVMGENGAGKTSFVRAVLGLLRPSAGEVQLQGARVEGVGLANVGYCAQVRGVQPIRLHLLSYQDYRMFCLSS